MIMMLFGTAAPGIAAVHADELPHAIPENVRVTLENRCIICHSDTSKKFGQLDLRQWTETPDGRFGFIHLDSFKKQRPSHYTMGVLLDRIITTDEDAHMPVGETLKPEELAPLVEWLSKQLEK